MLLTCLNLLGLPTLTGHPPLLFTNRYAFHFTCLLITYCFSQEEQGRHAIHPLMKCRLSTQPPVIPFLYLLMPSPNLDLLSAACPCSPFLEQELRTLPNHTFTLCQSGGAFPFPCFTNQNTSPVPLSYSSM